jgi:hypothetical protein
MIWLWIKGRAARILIVVPYVAMFCLAAVDYVFPHKTSGTMWLKLCCAAVGTAAQWFKDYNWRLFQRGLRERTLRGHLALVRDELVAQLRTSYQGHLRANVMTVVGPARLRILCCVGHYSPEERLMTWDKWQGACGYCYGQNEAVFADVEAFSDAGSYNDIRDATGQVPWGYTAEQWAITKHLKGIVSLPLWEENDKGRIWGVVNVDSDAPLTKDLVDNVMMPILETYKKPIAVCC